MIETKIGKMDLCNVIYNASGVYSTNSSDLYRLSLDKYYNSAILTKTCSKEPINYINKNEDYYDNNIYSIHSNNLNNLGIDFYIDYAKDFYNSNNKKKYIISTFVDDNYDVIENISNYSKYVDSIELNLSYFNDKKSIIGYDFNKMEEIIRKSSEILSNSVNFGIKLPPYFDILQFNKAIEIINNNSIDYITCIGNIPNGLTVNYKTEKTDIINDNYFYNIGGPSIKPTALSNIHYFYKNTKCSIVGCGGINSGKDAFEHILCGASAIQIGTYLQQYGNIAFENITNELKTIMDDKNYNNITDFKGKLKYL